VHRFGNFFINRLAEKVTTEVDNPELFSKTLLERGYLNGAAFKTDNLVQYHVGDTITSLNRCILGKHARLPPPPPPSFFSSSF